MLNKETIEKLASLADSLDQKGHDEEANAVDSLIQEAGEMPGIPDGTGPRGCGMIPDGTGPHGRGMGPGQGRGDGTGMKMKMKLVDLADSLDEKGQTEEASLVDSIVQEAAEGIVPFIYNDIKKLVDEGKSFEEVKKIIEEKDKGFTLKQEDYDEVKGKKEE